jgi:hypothetical protein
MADFAAVVAEIQERDSSLVDAAQLERAAELTPVVTAVESGADPGLDSFVAGARARIESEVVERRQRGIPVPPAGVQQPATRPRTRWVAGGLAAAAAVGLLFLGARGFLDASGDARRAPLQQAEFQAGEVDTQGLASRQGGTAEHASPDREAESGAEDQVREEAAAPLPAEDSIDPEGGIADSGAAKGRATDSSRERRGRKHGQRARRGGPDARGGSQEKAPRRDESLRELDAEAQRLLREGDTPGAEKRFHEIIRRGKGTRYADLAYGDLFTIARRHHGPAREAELWRDYLKTYPRGRYADDATAGLCRRAPAELRSKCWSEYLEHFPSGTYKSRALAATRSESP